MEHLDAVRQGAVEKYLLNELPPELRDQFEEHFFSCGECAEDLRAAATFLDLTRSELKAHPVSKPAPGNVRQTRRFFLWTPTFLVPALAASMLVVAYQNIVVLPRAKSEVAELRSAEVLPAISLLGSNSRGGDPRPVATQQGKPFLLLVDIPAEDRFASYTCEILSPTGAVAWHVNVSPQQARDTVWIRVPGVSEPGGVYTLLVRGNLTGTDVPGGNELARYHFVLQKRS